MGIVVVVCGKTCGKIEKNCRVLKTFACVYLKYRKHCGGKGVVIVVEVCDNICGNICVIWKGAQRAPKPPKLEQGGRRPPKF